MKIPYEEPILRLVGFRAAQQLAASWQWDLEYANETEAGSSDIETEYPDNPEGDF